MRFFELKTADSSKFWNIDIAGNCVTKSYGNIGNKGREVRDEYTDEHFAKKDALKLIAKRLKEGYVELPGGDGEDAKWFDEAAAAKAAAKAAKATKAPPKKTPVVPKEKRVPIGMDFVKSDLEVQHDFSGKALFGSLRIAASHTCPGNDVAQASNVNEGLVFFDNGCLAAVSESWSEVTDLFDLQKGTCCRIPSPDSERRIAGVLMDRHYLYALAIKGFEAESRNLVKYDLDTHEIVWTCGSSSSSITPRFTQDEEYIYASDVKMLYVISKALGKTVAKVELVNKMDKRQKIYSNTGKRFVCVHPVNETRRVLCGSLVNIALIDPLESEKIWEISSREYEKIMAYCIHEDRLYILGGNSRLLVVRIPDGKIEHRLDIEHGIDMRRCTEFHLDGGELCAIVRNDGDQRILLRIDPQGLTYRAEDYTAYMPGGSWYDLYEVIRDGRIVFVRDNRLSVIEKNTGKNVSLLEIPGAKRTNILDFVVVGNCIYLAQKTKGQKASEYHPDSAILHQIK